MTKPIRLKAIRREERRINSVKGLMEMFHIADRNNDSKQYQVIGASASNSSSSIALDPKIGKTKALFETFGLER